MAGRNANISVKIEGEADFGAARREAKAAIDDIEKAADVTLTPELDTSEIRKAIDLAKQLETSVGDRHQVSVSAACGQLRLKQETAEGIIESPIPEKRITIGAGSAA